MNIALEKCTPLHFFAFDFKILGKKAKIQKRSKCKKKSEMQKRQGAYDVCHRHAIVIKRTYYQIEKMRRLDLNDKKLS